jgi:hypothetical protein
MIVFAAFRTASGNCVTRVDQRTQRADQARRTSVPAPCFGEDFDQHGVRHASVEDDRRIDPALDRVDAGFAAWGSCRR